MEVQSYFDNKKQLPYIIHRGKKLYFPNDLECNISECYKALAVEQDPESSHRYVESFCDLEGKTVLDIGAAEGMFSLDVIDFVHKIYIFEFDEKWIKALEATFECWKEKVTIVKKYVNNVSDTENITIDDYMKEKMCNELFIKIDVEGAEQTVLEGALETLNKIPQINLAVCTYHKEKDAEEIAKTFTDLGIEYTFSSGYLFYEKQLRKALIRGSKKNKR